MPRSSSEFGGATGAGRYDDIGRVGDLLLADGGALGRVPTEDGATSLTVNCKMFDTTRTTEMIRSISDLLGCEIVGEDGEVGRIRDLFIDDETFKIRFVIAGKNKSHADESLVIPFAALGSVDWESRTVAIPMTNSRVMWHKAFGESDAMRIE